MEPFACPRRREGGPWDPNAEDDTWRDDRWQPGKPNPSHTVSQHGETKVLETRIGWLEAWPKPPLSCSFCGCCHPVDLFRLLDEDWEIEIAKRYKFYVNPPGYWDYMRRMIEEPIEPGSGDAGLEKMMKRAGPYQQSPIPPVKCYTPHFTESELGSINELIRENNWRM